MNCPNCNAVVTPGAAFCASCGKGLPSPAAQASPYAQPYPGSPQSYPPAGGPGGYPQAGGQPGYPPPPYGQPAPYGQPPMPPYGFAPSSPEFGQLAIATRTSGMAIAGFVLSFFCGLLGLIFSVIGLNECKASNGAVGGGGLATAGIVISIVSMLINIMVLASR